MNRSSAVSTAHGTAIFQRITDAIRRILAHEGIVVYNYVNDIFTYAESEDAHWVFSHLRAIIEELGLPINEDKPVAPDNVMLCMGIEINITNKTMRLPQEKIEEITY